LSATIIRNATIVNEGRIFNSDLLCRNGIIEKIQADIGMEQSYEEVNAEGLILFPGVIDDQVHFREPGLTHKADIYSESRAAVAGGTTSFMEMPNTVPNTLTIDLLEEKYKIASGTSLANYSFYLGASDNNIEELKRADPATICGIKIFMGSSTGNMLVDDEKVLENIFRNIPMLIATHCEDEATIRNNLNKAIQQFGDDIPVSYHPVIRSEEACFLSSSRAVALAKKHNSRLHILHISTAKETSLFTNTIPLSQKRITSEVCIHHLWFSDEDYASMGNRIKWNPAVKTPEDRSALLAALLDDSIDVIATDHAPHTLEEKSRPYLQAPSGGPLVQHSLIAMMELHKQGKISLEKIAEKMSHAPATCFRIKDRGFIREGYHADLVLVDPHREQKVSKKDLLYKCKWSPFEGLTFHSAVVRTFVNGFCAYDSGKINESQNGMRLKFHTD
jgi:dihydroorotase